MPQYTQEQQEALRLIKEWYDSDRQVFRLTGLAGTGKTYLISHLEEELGISVLYLCYTGKASNNLAVNGLESRTIHSVLYRPAKGMSEPPDSLVSRVIREMNLSCSMEACRSRLMEAFGSLATEKEIRFVRKDSAQEEVPSLLVIDEASMVSRVIYTDLMDLGVKVLLCGDPGQLPPIDTDKTWSALAGADYMLKSIQRQQADNPIIRLAHSLYHWDLDSIRYNEPVHSGDGMALVLNKNFAGDTDRASQAIDGLMAQADQVLCFTNKYRVSANQAMRERKGFTSPYPQPGDKLICTRNNWTKVTDGVPLVNGQMGECISFSQASGRGKKGRTGLLKFRPDYTDCILETKVALDPFDGGSPSDPKLDRFEFGYAVTVHKAQGSEWDTVLAVYDSKITVDNLKEWLYTAVTRARRQVILYLPKVASIKGIYRIPPKDGQA